MKRLWGVLFLAPLASCIAACATRFLDLPVVPGTGSEDDRPRVEAACSETVPSTEVVTLTWMYGKLQDDQRIDLTVYEDGFDQDRYASLWPLKSGQRPRILTVSRLRKRSAEPALRPRLKSVSSDPSTGSTTVTLEGLEGGLLYEFRLATLRGQAWVPGPAVEVEVPVCVTEQSEQIEP